jgi:hypothetical protein
MSEVQSFDEFIKELKSTHYITLTNYEKTRGSNNPSI